MRELLLNALFEGIDGQIELTALYPREHKHTGFIKEFVSLPEALAGDGDFFTRTEELDIYFGACKRVRNSGHKASIKQSKAVWVDIDKGSKEDNADRLLKYKNVPSYIVDSGNGLHAYWVLDEPCSDLDLIEGINRKLVQDFDGDSHSWNINRLLRLPGTVNRKDKDNPKDCSVIYESNTVYKVSDFDFIATEAYDVTYLLDWEQVGHWEDTQLPICEVDLDLFQSNYIKPYRSNIDFKVCMYMASNSLSKEKAAYVLLSPYFIFHTKTDEMTLTERKRYITRTVCRAYETYRRNVNANQDSKDATAVAADDKGVKA